MSDSVIYLRNRNVSIYILLIFSVVIAGFSIVEIINKPTGDTGWYFAIIFFSSLWIALYIIAAWRTFKHIYLFSTAYLTALIMFHLGLFYQRVIGDIKFPSSWEHGSFSPWLESAGWHTILALSAFGIGFAIAVSSGKNNLKFINPILIGHVKKVGHWSSIGLLVASVVFFIFAIYSYGNIFNYARHEIFSSHADSRGFGVFMMIFPGSVLLYLFSASNRNQNLFGLGLALFAFVIFMFSGYRSTALFPCLVGVVMWIKSGRKIPVLVVVSGISIILVLIAASGYLRTMGKYSELSLTDVTKALDEASIESSISEMGSSVKALASVLQLVPNKDEYRYGSSYAHSLIDSLPNIGVRVNIEGSREHALQEKNTDPDALQQLRPADWLTYRIAPWHFSRGYGVGFSAIAEPYLNFGTIGVLFFFIGLGFVLGKLDSIPIYQSPRVLVFSASMLWFLISTVRNDSSNLFKPCVFTILILLAWWAFSKIVLMKNIQWRV